MITAPLINTLSFLLERSEVTTESEPIHTREEVVAKHRNPVSACAN